MTRARGDRDQPAQRGVAGPPEALATQPDGPPFAHASEAELARILDFYAVRWEYEPHRFPIMWNLDGAVVESFSPDFWLPDLGLYLEMTTLKQRLVRKKNRKLRRLRELYPDVRIKLFYARDFRALMLKYGKLALVDALSGAPGQVVPGREDEIDPAAAVAVLDPAAAVAVLDPGEPGALGMDPGPPAEPGADVAAARSGFPPRRSRTARRRRSAAARRAARAGRSSAGDRAAARGGEAGRPAAPGPAATPDDPGAPAADGGEDGR